LLRQLRWDKACCGDVWCGLLGLGGVGFGRNGSFWQGTERHVDAGLAWQLGLCKECRVELVKVSVRHV